MKRLLVLVLALALGSCITANRQKRAAAHAELGTAYLREGNAADAIKVLRDAVRLDPRNWNAWEKLALAYSAQGAADLAERAFERAIRLDPKNAEINNNYGLFLLSQGQIGAAIAHFETALEDVTYRKPALVENNLGYALFLEKRTDEAIATLDDAIRRAPHLCQARLHRGMAYRQRGDDDHALQDFETVIQLCGSDMPSAYLEAAPILIERGQKAAGCAYLDEAVAHGKDDQLRRAASRLREQECS